MSKLELRLLNEFQRDLPLVREPFADIAARLETTPGWVLSTLRRLHRRGVVSRVGPVFRPHAIGASTLAAMAVPSSRLTQVASLINGYFEVNHNYHREHAVNLWFVLTAACPQAVDRVIGDIATRTGLEVLNLPLIEDYHIDLGFCLNHGSRKRDTREPNTPQRPGPVQVDTQQQRLIGCVQHGLPLVERPYADVARRIGLDERGVLDTLGRWLDDGVVKRLGVVVRHHELGYRANAMVVWDVPDDRVSTLGKRMADLDFVTLCYRRRRHPPRWHNNLYCMIHGRRRDTVLRQLSVLERECDITGHRHEVLFCQRRFKQGGASYCNHRSQDLH